MCQSRSAKNKVYSTHYVGAFFLFFFSFFYEALLVTTVNQLKGICDLKFSLANSCQSQSGEEESLLLPKICILFYQGNAAQF